MGREFITYKIVFRDSQQCLPGIDEKGGIIASGEIPIFLTFAAPL